MFKDQEEPVWPEQKEQGEGGEREGACLWGLISEGPLGLLMTWDGKSQEVCDSTI